MCKQDLILTYISAVALVIEEANLIIKPEITVSKFKYSMSG